MKKSTSDKYHEYFQTKKILVTGGAGFVGSNLLAALTELGAQVTVVDNFHPDYGGNEYNFKGMEGKFELVKGDICDVKLMKELASKVDLVYHIAAQCSHVDSMIDPWFDIEYNCKGTMSILEAVKASPKKPAIVYAGTRAMVGAPMEIPVKEGTLPNPTDIYGVNKLAAELYGSVYARVHRIPFVSMRLTNCYGERHQMKSGKYGILNWFISLGMQQKPIKVFGTGEQLRDYLYIQDAIDVFLRAGHFTETLRQGELKFPKVQLSGTGIPFAVFNIGSGKGLPFVDCAKMVSKRAESPLEMVAWPSDRKAIETGDFVSDGTATKEILGWQSTTSFEEGLEKTFQYYQSNLKHYL